MTAHVLLIQSRQKELEAIERTTLVAHLDGRRYTAINMLTQNLSLIDIRPYSHVIMSGSSVTISDGILPWFTVVTRFIHDCLNAHKPFLGICFGFQMLAWSLGGKVERGTYAAGSMPITRRAPEHPVFRRLPEQCIVNTLHTDYVTQLGELKNAGYSEQNPNEMAFHPRAPLIGVQFHPEHTRASATKMLDIYQKTGLSYPDSSLRVSVQSFVNYQPPVIEYFLELG